MKRMAIIVIFTILMLSACLGPSGSTDTVLVSYSPVQCFETAWEAHWFENDDKTWDDWHALTENEQVLIVKNYIEEELDVNVIDIAHYPLPPDMGVCAACGCSRGDHYEVRILEDDLELMQFNGFRLIEEEE